MKKRKEFRHLTEHDRDRIQALYVWGHKQKEIAEVVEVSPGTISRELQRYDKKTWRYSAKRAKEDAREKRAESKRPGRNPHRESSIGLIRRWFLPKGTDLSQISNQTFQSMLHLLNHKYRKSNGYLSAYELAHERGLIEKVPKVSLAKAIASR